MERLHKSCRRLVWLNPLLRFAGYEAKSQGARAMCPHVDELRTVHNLESLADLAAVLGDQEPSPVILTHSDRAILGRGQESAVGA